MLHRSNYECELEQTTSHNINSSYALFERSWSFFKRLVGFYGTAAQYRLYSAGECSECDNECACRVGGVVPPCTLEQWVNSPPQSHWGCVPSSMRVKPFYTLGQWAYSILHLAHRGNTRHYDIILNRQIVPVSMQFECLWARVDVWWVCTTLHSQLLFYFSSSGWILLPSSHWGGVPRTTGVKLFYTLWQCAYSIPPPNPQGKYTTLWYNT